MSNIRVACGLSVAPTTILDSSNMYDTTFSNMVRLYDMSKTSGFIPLSRVTLVQSRVATLRLALRKTDDTGYEIPVDLSNLDPWLLLHSQKKYYQRGNTAVFPYQLTVEAPASNGLCYVELTATDLFKEGNYTGEVCFKTGDDYAHFARFEIFVIESNI